MASYRVLLFTVEPSREGGPDQQLVERLLLRVLGHELDAEGADL